MWGIEGRCLRRVPYRQRARPHIAMTPLSPYPRRRIKGILLSAGRTPSQSGVPIFKFRGLSVNSKISRIRPAAVTALGVIVILGATAGATLAARAPKPPAAPIVTAQASTGTLGDKLNLNVVIKTSGKVGPA